MQNQITICQQLAWEPNPENNPVGGMPVKEGRNLPNSVTEDVGGFSLCPTYSEKQLKRIERLMVRDAELDLIVKLKAGGRLEW